MKNNNTLNGKDFINIGIFTAIYMVIVIAIACTVGLIPVGFILLPVILPIIGRDSNDALFYQDQKTRHVVDL